MEGAFEFDAGGGGGGGDGDGGNEWKSQIDKRTHGVYVSWILKRLTQILSPYGNGKLTDLRKVAGRLEGRLFAVASSMVDFNEKIAQRLLYLENELDDEIVLQKSTSQLVITSPGPHITIGIPQKDWLPVPVKFNDVRAVQKSSRSKLKQSSGVLLLQKNSSNQQSQIIKEKRRLDQEASSGGNEKKPRCNDRIGDLHDDLLHRIMSFLPAREVVCTSALSPRWRPLWASVPCLDIDIDHFDKDRDKFSNFVENLLLWRGIDRLETLRLHSFAIDAANFWIEYSLMRNVRSIEFMEDIAWEPLFLNPHIIDFSSPYLQSLKLTNVILSTRVFDPLNHACPNLENLQLADSILEFSEISSGSLKTLEIIDCSVSKDLLIRTNSLVSVRFQRSESRCSSRADFQIAAAVTLYGLSNVKRMELSAPVRKVVFGKVTPGHTMFMKLTSLSLGEWCLSDKLSPLVTFLQHSPMLEEFNLKLQEIEFVEDAETGAILMPKGISFAAHHLKKVTIHCSEGD